MKRSILFSIALVLSFIFVALMSSDSTARAQRNRTFIYDSGIVALGANQKLVMMVDASLDSDIVFHEFGYGLNVCSGSVCRHSIVSQNQSNPINLAIGEGASDTVAFSQDTSGARITVTSKNPNLIVTSQVIDSVSGAIVSYSYSFGQPNM